MDRCAGCCREELADRVDGGSKKDDCKVGVCATWSSDVGKAWSSCRVGFFDDETRDADERGAGVNRLREANEEGVGAFKEDEREGVELKDLSAIGVVTESDGSDGEVESVLEGLVVLWRLRKVEEEGVDGIDAAIVTVAVEG